MTIRFSQSVSAWDFLHLALAPLLALVAALR
jgi:hypothetical protein